MDRIITKPLKMAHNSVKMEIWIHLRFALRSRAPRFYERCGSHNDQILHSSLTISTVALLLVEQYVNE
jgi:hypothetical protein